MHNYRECLHSYVRSQSFFFISIFIFQIFNFSFYFFILGSVQRGEGNIKKLKKEICWVNSSFPFFPLKEPIMKNNIISKEEVCLNRGHNRKQIIIHLSLLFLSHLKMKMKINAKGDKSNTIKMLRQTQAKDHFLSRVYIFPQYANSNDTYLTCTVHIYTQQPSKD